MIGKHYEVTSKWLQTLYQRRKQWAARWTWCHLTLGAHSTQRSDSVHAAIKHFLSRHTLITELATKIEEYRQTVSERGEGKAIRIALRNLVVSSLGHYVYLHPVELDLSKRLSPLALSIAKSQVIQCMNYSIEDKYTESSTEKQVYIVKQISTSEGISTRLDSENSHENMLTPSSTNVNSEIFLDHEINAADLGLSSKIVNDDSIFRQTTQTNCTCLFHSCWGLRCRHMFRVYLENRITRVPEEVITPFWLVKSDEQM